MLLLSLLLSSEWTGLEISEEEFTELVATELEQASEACSVIAFETRALSMSCADGGETVLYLDSLWASWQEEPQEREAQLASWVAVILAPPGEAAWVQTEQLMPVVRSKAFLEAVSSLEEPLYDPLAGDYLVFYALDLPDRVQFLSMRDLDELGMTHAALRATALENLGRLEIDIVGQGPVYGLVAGGTYEASLLAREGLWRELQESAASPIKVVAPTRDVVFFTFSEKGRVLRRMERHARRIYEVGPYVVSPTLLQWTDEGWVAQRDIE